MLRQKIEDAPPPGCLGLNKLQDYPKDRTLKTIYSTQLNSTFEQAQDYTLM